jgi:type VI secretion system protein ImpA
LHASIEPVEGHALSASVNPALAQASAGALMAVPGRPAMPAPTLQGSVTDQREQVRQSLAQVRQWIELHEPSSPVSVLLKQAERMWGKRFSEVAHIIPAELLQAWDQDQ